MSLNIDDLVKVAKSRPKEANTFALPPGHDQYQTPPHLRAALDLVYHFDDYDPCPVNPKGMRQADGLAKTPDRVKRYIYNPPYSDVVPWLENSVADLRRGIASFALLKADTSTDWFHDLVIPYARPLWVRGRLSFPFYDKKKRREVIAPAPFNSFVAAYEPGRSLLPQSVIWRDKGVRIVDLKPENWHVLNP